MVRGRYPWLGALWLGTFWLGAVPCAADNGIQVTTPVLSARQVGGQASAVPAAQPNASAQYTQAQQYAPAATQTAGNTASYGAAPSQSAAPAAPNIAQRSQASGNCRLEAAPDKQTLSLVGSDALAKKHVPLGEFRVQQTVHAPDGRWAVALVKLRGQAQYAVMSFDLTRCEPQVTQDLGSVPLDARFESDAAVISLQGSEQRVPLTNRSLR